jgi:hypothetical protein
MENDNKVTKTKDDKPIEMIPDRIRELGLLMPLYKIYTYICITGFVYAAYFSKEGPDGLFIDSIKPFMNAMVMDMLNIFMTLAFIACCYKSLIIIAPLHVKILAHRISGDKTPKKFRNPYYRKSLSEMTLIEIHTQRFLQTIRIYLLVGTTVVAYLFFFKHQDPELMYSDSLEPLLTYCAENIKGILYSALSVFGAYISMRIVIPYVMISLYIKLKK